ncbi:MAG: hypothetical protein NT154_08310 [Verrucomicrobia bacterium]|nr:hypothetical protein [Verrucomicrobiota bacterium]
MFSFFHRDPSQLLKSATAHRNAGHLDKAIADLIEAYRAIAKGNVSYPVETYLRLPLYLQEANRADEAWSQFYSLLQNGFHLMPHDACLLPMFHAAIYDKMRLFLQRQQALLLACSYGVGSRYATALGLYRQKRVDELLAILDADLEQEIVTKMLKKAKAVEKADAILSVIAPFRKSIATTEPIQVIYAVCNVLQISPQYRS